MKKFLLLLLFVLPISGCQAPPIELNKYEPSAFSPKMKPFLREGMTYVEYESEKYKVSVSLVEYKNVFVTPIEITNKTGTDVTSFEYSITLSDGRDYKPITMLSEAMIAKIRQQFDSGEQGKIKFEGTEKVLEDAVNTLITTLRPSSDKSVASALDRVLNEYFVFRPIYARESRKGIIAYLLDFRLEYPLDLVVTLKGERMDFQFSSTKESISLQ